MTLVGDARRKVMKDVLKGDGDETIGKCIDDIHLIVFYCRSTQLMHRAVLT